MFMAAASVSAQTKKGDLTGDGKIDKNDVICLVRKILSFAEEETNDDDINQDGMVNIEDITSLVDLIVSYPCPDRHHPHVVDLGLPSGTKWACCNVGASSPKERGCYYAWGETEEKELYLMETYPYYDTNEDEFIDLGNISGTKYDAAHVKWGGDWRMPTREEAEELFELTKEQQYISDIKQEVFLGPNGNCIYVPYTDTQFGLYKTEIECTWPMIWTSTLQDNIMAAYMGGGSCARYAGIPVRPVYDPSAFAFSLSEDSMNMFVNSTRSVYIEMGSGEYELQYDQTDIIDAELIMADKEEDPDAKDEIAIYGIAEGTAQLKVVDKKYNKTVTIDVNMRTPTPEDLSDTEEYISSVRNFIKLEEEKKLDAFQNNLLLWLDDQDWVEHACINDSNDFITIKMNNGFETFVLFQDISFFNHTVDEENNSRELFPIKKDPSATDNDNNEIKCYNVATQTGDAIIGNTNILLIHGLDMLKGGGGIQSSTAGKELGDLSKITRASPINLNYKWKSKTLSFLDNLSESKYGMIIISQTHGVENYKGAFLIEDNKAWNALEDVKDKYTLYKGAVVYIEKNDPNGKPKISETDIIKESTKNVFMIMPLLGKIITKESSIVYAGYCWSNGIRQSGNSFFGYNTVGDYKTNTDYLGVFLNNISNGMTFKEATAEDEGFKGFDFYETVGDKKIKHSVRLSKSNTKHRYFSITTNKVTIKENGNACISGQIRGFKNLKYIHEGFYVNVYGKNEEPDYAQVTKGKRFYPENDGKFEIEYPIQDDILDQELYAVVGFLYGYSYYHGNPIPFVKKGLCPNNLHPHTIDLGIGVKWSCCNLGAHSPEEEGDKYAWGETEAKNSFLICNYKNKHERQEDEELWVHGEDGVDYVFEDIGKNISGTDKDAARSKKGSPWHMPTLDEVKILKEKCTCRGTRINGVGGDYITGPSGKSIFLPCETWTGTQCTEYESVIPRAWYIHPQVNTVWWYFYDAVYNGRPIRPVRR